MLSVARAIIVGAAVFGFASLAQSATWGVNGWGEDSWRPASRKDTCRNAAPASPAFRTCHVKKRLPRKESHR